MQKEHLVEEVEVHQQRALVANLEEKLRHQQGEVGEVEQNHLQVVVGEVHQQRALVAKLEGELLRMEVVEEVNQQQVGVVCLE